MNKEIVTQLTNEKILKQSHELNIARYKLSALSLDILSLFLTQVRKEDIDFKEFRVTHKMLEEKLNRSINRNDLRKVPKEILSNPFSIKEGKTYKYFNWCSTIAYNESEYWLEFKMDNDLRDYVLNIESNFVLTDLTYITKLKNSYSKRIYSILKQFTKTGFYTVSVDNLSDILDTTSKYPSYSDFKKRCVVPSLEQINEFSDLNVSFKEIKSGRKVVRLEFFIKAIAKRNSKKSTKKVEVKKGVESLDNWLNSSKEEEILDIELIK